MSDTTTNMSKDLDAENSAVMNASSFKWYILKWTLARNGMDYDWIDKWKFDCYLLFVPLIRSSQCFALSKTFLSLHFSYILAHLVHKKRIVHKSAWQDKYNKLITFTKHNWWYITHWLVSSMIQLDFIGFHCVSLDFIGFVRWLYWFHWISLCFIGFHCFIWFHCVSLCFIGFHWSA